jgi:hypothetical protein
MLYLLSIYFNLRIDEKKFEQSMKQVNFSKIVERDYLGNEISVIWNTPLFEEEKKFDNPMPSPIEDYKQ